ncbi:PREDICTED: dehydrogenase/reductase SDR family member 7 isoform X1 [Nanorana parkeri]|uniref:dehydrogenase/reductase SDR family member 7 isoform X1 n=1 Tax=Nanorana parkeri TaxID=125878 RepID=UPI0008544E7E|nr:PREDICTED: dehydrogenase/reductase SDR family member 7 isoform X1 [Nanorana parkeri]XP_018418101.1 PREDICTED: dehydrogenase/reductase SDR family member 7 isoform X1 [Nanorana parkeri]
MALLILLMLCCLAYFLIQIIRFIKADADLTLLWAERFGHSPESKFRGSVVWVTGASSGIGEALCYQLAKLGAQLVLSSRREAELLRVKKKCIEISGLEDKDVLVVPLDLTNISAHKAATDKVVEHFGRVDILLNNSGRSQRSLCLDTDLDVFRGLMEINYFGTISLTKHVLPHMIERKKGKIVTISSVTGFIGVPLSTGYAASKHAIQGFFNSLRIELGCYPGITVSNICPGPVQSNIVQNAFTERSDQNFGSSADQSYKMSAERCARLTLVTAANDLNESWISDHPYLLICYIWQYAPTWAWWITGRIGQKRIENFKSGVDADSSYFSKKTS